MKNKSFFIDSKQRRTALTCSKNLCTLLRGITSKHNGDFCCLNCLHLFRTKNKLESQKRGCESKYFCGVVMHSEDAEILKFSQYRKSNKAPPIIYANLESLIKRIDG